MNREAATKAIALTLTDPWDLVSVAGLHHSARLIASGKDEAGAEALLLVLDLPFDAFGNKYEYLLASPRHLGDSFSSGKTTPCNLQRLPQEVVESSNPFCTTSSRTGKDAAIGGLSLL